MSGDWREFTPPQKTVDLLRLIAGLGGVTLLAGFFLAPERTWPDLLLASYFLVGLGLAGTFFVALEYVTGASWSVALRRVPEALAALLPVGALGLALVFLLRPSLYPWLRGVAESAEGFLAFKRVWLSQGFFLARAAFYLVAWMAFAYAIVRISRRQDADGSVQLPQRNKALSTAFVVVFAFTFWLASSDWIMSLEPQWYSTIFGVYNFAGLFLGGLAAIAILVVWMRKLGPLARVVREQHLVDLARLIFAFGTFWAYIWFSQYMLIWYANLPEETAYFIARLEAAWAPLFVANLLLNWAIPFLVLLPRASKRSPTVLVVAASIVLAGRFLDLYLMVLPPFVGARPLLGVWEIGTLLGTIGLCGLVFLHAFAQAAPVPLGDPRLQESLEHH